MEEDEKTNDEKRDDEPKGESEPPVLPPQEIRAVLEALIFASPQPVTPQEIGRVLGGVPKEAWL